VSGAHVLVPRPHVPQLHRSCPIAVVLAELLACELLAVEVVLSSCSAVAFVVTFVESVLSLRWPEGMVMKLVLLKVVLLVLVTTVLVVPV
jgi:hypothetical protein